MDRGQTKAKVLPLPDTADIFFICVMQVLLFARPNFLFGDGSTGWHLVVGKYILENRTIPHADILSYTFPGKLWFDYEWLAQLIAAVLVKLGGLNLLNVTASASIALLIVFIYRRCCSTGCHFLLVVILTLLGSIASSVHWLARPHLFTFWGVYLFSTMLDDFSKGAIKGTRLVICLSLAMLIWVNCHPGFLFGFGILCIYLISTLIQYLFIEREKTKISYLRQAKWLSFAVITIGITSCCNPYGAHLYWYMSHYLQQKTVLDVTNEFISPVFHGDVQPTCLAILFACFVVGLAITRRPLSFPQLMTALAFGHLSLSGIRNLPLFVIVVLPLIAQLLSKTIFSQGEEGFQFVNSRIQTLLTSLGNLNAGFMETESRCRLHLLPILCFVALIAIGINGGMIFNQAVLQTSFDQVSLPTKTLTAIKALKLDSNHGFNLDNWGGLLSYQVAIPVFIDDRLDFYGQPFFLNYDIVLNALPGWHQLLNQYNFKWALIPNDSRISNALQQTPGWKLAVRDNAASLYIETSKKPSQL